MKISLHWPRLGRTNTAPDQRLSREAYVALFIHGCFQFGASMSGLFLNLYLWRLTEDLVINSIFNIILYGATPFVFALGGWIAKKQDRMVTYRLGIVLISVFFLLVIIAGERVVTYYVWFALFYGFALSLYWTGYIVLMYDVTDERNRARFLGLNMIVFNSAGLAGPALSGFLISFFDGLKGYIVTFGAAAFLFGLASFFSLRINRIESHRRTYYLKFSGIMMKRNPLLVFALLSFFLLGLFQGLMLFLPNILMYQTVGREDQVGYLTVFFALLTIITGVFISRRKAEANIRRELLVTVVLISLGAFVLLVDINLWTVIVFMSVFSLLSPLVVNTLTYYYYQVMDRLPLKGNFRIESVVIREFSLNAGRVLSIVLPLLFTSDLNSKVLPIVLSATAVTQIGMAWLVKEKL